MVRLSIVTRGGSLGFLLVLVSVRDWSGVVAVRVSVCVGSAVVAVSCEAFRAVCCAFCGALVFVSNLSGKGKRVAASFRDKVSPRLRIDADRPAESESEEPPTLHTVRLYFAEPDDQPSGSRVFDVRLQGKLVASRLDIVAEAGQPQTILVKGFRDVPIGDALQIEFEPHAGQRVLCGVEIIRRIDLGSAGHGRRNQLHASEWLASEALH